MSQPAHDQAIAAATDLLAAVTDAAAREGLKLAHAISLPQHELQLYLQAASAQSAALTALIHGEKPMTANFSAADQIARERGLDLPLLRTLAQSQTEKDPC